MSAFRWYRRWRGGRWARVTGYLWGHRWVRVSNECLERVDEDWTVTPSQWIERRRMPYSPREHRIFTDDRGQVWHAWNDRHESGAQNLTACNERIPAPLLGRSE